MGFTSLLETFQTYVNNFLAHPEIGSHVYAAGGGDKAAFYRGYAKDLLHVFQICGILAYDCGRRV